MESTNTQKLVAEALGTFVLVFFGVGTALMWDGDPLITALVFGISMMVMVYAVGRVSGGHFNPAISAGLAMGGRIAWREVPLYAAAQVAGAADPELHERAIQGGIACELVQTGSL